MKPIRNCENCANLGSDGDGPEYNGNWPICEAGKPRANLRSFPFKKEQPCHEPNFWKYCEEDGELSAMFDQEVKEFSGEGAPNFDKTYARFKEKHEPGAQPPHKGGQA